MCGGKLAKSGAALLRLLILASLLATCIASRTAVERSGREAGPVVSAQGIVPEAAGPPGPGIGLQLDPWPLSDPDLRARLEAIAALGIRHALIPLHWSAVESEPGRYRWADLDRVLQRMAEAGIAPSLRLQSAPDWARRDPPPPEDVWLCGPPEVDLEAMDAAAPPSDPTALGRFARDLAERHASRIDALEIWHEPNILPGWRALGPDPEDYGRLLLAVADAVEPVAPDLLLISAAPAPVVIEASPVCYMSDLVFLDRLARTGALARVDAVGWQSLAHGLPPGTAPREEELDFRRVELARSILEDHGLSLPIWIQAWGWPGAAEDLADVEGREIEPAALRAAVADWCGQAWDLAARDWPWVDRMFLWQPVESDAAVMALWDDRGRPTALAEEMTEVASGRLPGPELPPAEPSGRLDALRTAFRTWWTVLVAAGLGMALILTGISERRGAKKLQFELPGPIAERLDAGRRRARRTWAPLRRVSMVRLSLAFLACLLINALAPWPLASLSLLVLLLLAIARPAVALGALTAGLPFFYFHPLQVGPRPVNAIVLLLALLLVGVAIRAWLDGQGPSAFGTDRAAGRSGLDRAALLLLVWSGFSPLWAERPALAIYEWRTVILEPLLLYALLRCWPDRRRAARIAMTGLVLGAIAAAMLGLIGVLAVALGLEGPLSTGVAAEGVLRARGPYGSPNNLALVLGRASAVSLAWALWAPRGRAFARGALAPLALGMLATFSRGAAVAGLPALATCTVWIARPRPSGRLLLRGAGLLLVLALALAPFAGSERIRETFDLQPGSTAHYRLRLWQSSLQMIEDRPWLGFGLDNFHAAYRDRYVQRDVIQERGLNHPHNLLLDWWTRLGLPGLVLLLWLIAGNLRAGLRALSMARGEEARAGPGPPSAAWTRALAGAGLGMQVYALAHGLVDNHFFLVDLASAWWIAQAGLLTAGDAKRS